MSFRTAEQILSQNAARNVRLEKEGYVPGSVTYVNGYTPEEEDALIAMANGQPQTKFKDINVLNRDEFFANIRKYGRDGIYMQTESEKRFWAKVRERNNKRK